MVGKFGNQIYELGFAPRRVVIECLARYLPSRATKLILNVVSRFFDSLRPRGARPEINKPLNMSKGFLAGKFLPNFRGAAVCCRGREHEGQSPRCKCDRCSTIHRLTASRANAHTQRRTHN